MLPGQQREFRICDEHGTGDEPTSDPICAQVLLLNCRKRAGQSGKRVVPQFLQAMLSRPLQFVCAAALVAMAGPSGTPQFEVTSPRGIDFILQNSPTQEKYLIETSSDCIARLCYN